MVVRPKSVLCLAMTWLALSALASSCEVADDGFHCGTPLGSDGNVVQRCARNLEVCICATTSCAIRDVGQFRSGGAGENGSGPCPSGYRYVETPFAAKDWAGECVPVSHLALPVVGDEKTPGPLCPTFPQSAGSGGRAAQEGGTGGQEGGTSGSGGMLEGGTAGAGGVSGGTSGGAAGAFEGGAGGISSGGSSDGGSSTGGEGGVITSGGASGSMAMGGNESSAGGGT